MDALERDDAAPFGSEFDSELRSELGSESTFGSEFASVISFGWAPSYFAVVE